MEKYYNGEGRDEKIEINFRKTCSCPDSHINCLTPKEWVKGQVAIWEFLVDIRIGQYPDGRPHDHMRTIPPKVLKTFERMKKKEPSHIELKNIKNLCPSCNERMG